MNLEYENRRLGEGLYNVTAFICQHYGIEFKQIGSFAASKIIIQLNIEDTPIELTISNRAYDDGDDIVCRFSQSPYWFDELQDELNATIAALRFTNVQSIPDTKSKTSFAIVCKHQMSELGGMPYETALTENDCLHEGLACYITMLDWLVG